MRLNLILISLSLTACSQLSMSDMGNLVSTASSGSSGPTSAWQNLPKNIENFLYADNSPVQAGRRSSYETYVDDDLAAIYKDGKCYGPNGKKLESNNLCKEVVDLVGKIKSIRSELMNLHNVKIPEKGDQYYVGYVADKLSQCTEDFQEFNEDESNGDTPKQMRECKPFLTSYLATLSKKSSDIKDHPRAKDLGVDKFDAFYFLSSSISEPKVRVALSTISKQTPSSHSKGAKNSFEPDWDSYCLMLIGYENADQAINSASTLARRQKLKNEKEGMKEVISQIRSRYKKNTGKELDESKCKNMYQ